MAPADHHDVILLLHPLAILAVEMRILIVGGGGREHALAWRLAKSPGLKAMYTSPGNPGLSNLADCFPAPSDTAGYAQLAERLSVDLTVVGPEAPLVAGIVDEFQMRGLKIIGPTQAAARLEGSKLFAKAFFRRAGIPTAREGSTIREFSFPVVIKADGLAAGKGVVVAQNEAEAAEALARLGPNVLIEEYLEGEEASFIGLSNGQEIAAFPATQDHKRLLDDDQGPNTGGMGAYVDGRILTPSQTGEVMDRIMLPAIRQMNKDGTPFTGFLYAGLMMTDAGPKILEFNVRLGDPETQTLMHTFDGDLAEVLMDVAHGRPPKLPPEPVESSVCVVLAAEGYPDSPQTGQPIHGLDEAGRTGATVFHAGTRLEGGQLVTSGGRVLGVTAKGSSLPAAISNAYRAVENIHFDGMQYRKDIGRKGLRRW